MTLSKKAVAISNKEYLFNLIDGMNADAETILNYYCKLVYKKTGSYLKASEITGFERCTVKKGLWTQNKKAGDNNASF